MALSLDALNICSCKHRLISRIRVVSRLSWRSWWKPDVSDTWHALAIKIFFALHSNTLLLFYPRNSRRTWFRSLACRQGKGNACRVQEREISEKLNSFGWLYLYSVLLVLAILTRQVDFGTRKEPSQGDYLPIRFFFSFLLVILHSLFYFPSSLSSSFF